MFGLFTSRKSPVRRRVESLPGVRRTWIEWTIENDMREPTLVVECTGDLDPDSPDFDRNDFVDIMAAVRATEGDEAVPPRVRVVPCTSDG